MSNLSKEAIKAVNTVFASDSIPGIILRGIYHRSIKLVKSALLLRKHNKAVMSLMDIDTLNERISYVKNLASSNNAQKTFYVVSKDSLTAGLFAFIGTLFAQVLYALAKGMIPVVDMQNHQSPYLEEGELGNVNAYEKFFEQPCGYGLNDIISGKAIYNEVVCQTVLPFVNNIRDYDLLFSKHIDLWASIYKNFFKLNDKTAQYVDREYNKLIKPDMRVLGVHCRGTDYVKMRPQHHQIQPDVGDVISKVKEAMPQWGCDYLYIASEERGIIERFRNAIPGRVLTVSQRYYDELDIDYTQTLLGGVRFERENDAYLRGVEYISSIIILSRCTSVVMGACAGSMAALYINGGKFENTYIYNLGVYS